MGFKERRNTFAEVCRLARGGVGFAAITRLRQELADLLVAVACELGDRMTALGRLAQLAQADDILGCVGAASVRIALRNDDPVPTLPGTQRLDADARGL